MARWQGRYDEKNETFSLPGVGCGWLARRPPSFWRRGRVVWVRLIETAALWAPIDTTECGWCLPDCRGIRREVGDCYPTTIHGIRCGRYILHLARAFCF